MKVLPKAWRCLRVDDCTLRFLFGHRGTPDLTQTSQVNRPSPKTTHSPEFQRGTTFIQAIEFTPGRRHIQAWRNHCIKHSRG